MIANLFFSQAVRELMRYADTKCSGFKLPVPVKFILDDFATNVTIGDFPRMISSFRSRQISVMIMENDAAEFLADQANGDARAAINAVELGVLTTPKGEDGKIHITLEVAGECIQKRVLRYDRDGDNHYDTVSAFIKSMPRGRPTRS